MNSGYLTANPACLTMSRMPLTDTPVLLTASSGSLTGCSGCLTANQMSLTGTPGLLTAGSGSLTASSGRLTANSGPLTTSRISVVFRVMGYFAMFYRDDGNGKAKIGR